MEFTISRSCLMKPLQVVSGVVEKRQTLPILSNVLISWDKNSLSLTGTDLEIELIGKVELQNAKSAGAITVSARKLLDICRALPDDAELQFNLDGAQLVIRSGASRFLLTTLPAQDFPNFENGPYSIQFEISEAKLKRLMSKTHFAMGQQDVRHYLNGALLDIHQGIVKCVATDGHRLAFSNIDEENVSAESIKVILPRKSILELVRLLDTDSDKTVEVSVGESHFSVKTPGFTFISKLINAQYPEYEKLIPRNVTNMAMVSRDALKQALVRTAILSNEKFRGIRFQLDKDQLRIVANNPEQEEAEEIVPLHYQGGELEIGFNVAYLLDVVSALACEQVKFCFNDPNSGVLIEPQDKSDSLYVVMPMRL